MKRKIFIAGILSCTLLQCAFASVLQYKADYISSDFAKTKYPLVFAHGWGLGFSRLGTENFSLDYWYQIAPDLARNGASIFVPSLSVINSTEVRGEQLLQQIDEVLAITGKSKVNLIGHSHGGPTIQYIEGVAPEKVASMTSVAGAMKGSQVANTLNDAKLFNSVTNLVMTNLIAQLIQFSEGTPNLPRDYNASVNSLTFEGMSAFNTKFPTAAIPSDCDKNGEKLTSNGIYHYSWIGSSLFTNIIDPDNIIIGATSLMMGNHQGTHDGLVTQCSAKYGQVIRNDYRWNHFDEVNQFLGLKGLFAQDPVQVFREHANRLKLQGL